MEFISFFFSPLQYSNIEEKTMEHLYKVTP